MAFYLINKEQGVSSADVVDAVKKSVGAEKAGHGGTLDPFATGLLVIATEGHTRLLSRMLDERKTYEGVITFGKTTETLDPESEISEEKPVNFDLEDLRIKINAKFIGQISQVPPRFSAIKVKGRKAYDLAREGVEFKLTAVNRRIYRFDISQISETEYKFSVEVSSGTYIRALARDLGEAMGTVAMLTVLKRTKIGAISLDAATSVESPVAVDIFKVMGIESFDVTEEQMKFILHGKTVSIPMEKGIYSFIAKHGNDEILVSSKSENQWKIVKRIK